MKSAPDLDEPVETYQTDMEFEGLSNTEYAAANDFVQGDGQQTWEDVEAEESEVAEDNRDFEQLIDWTHNKETKYSGKIGSEHKYSVNAGGEIARNQLKNLGLNFDNSGEALVETDLEGTEQYPEAKVQIWNDRVEIWSDEKIHDELSGESQQSVSAQALEQDYSSGGPV